MSFPARTVLADRFTDDMRAHVLSNLPCAPAERLVLELEPIAELLIIYFNWLDRLIDARSRTLHLSDDIQANRLRWDGRYRLAFDAICTAIEQGRPLTGHLSRRIRVGYDAVRHGPKDLKHRRDLDLLLSDWGVHHLHLSTIVEQDGFVARSGPLLLGVFHRTDAYLIDIIEHGDWSRQSLMEIVVRHWPEAGILYALPRVTGLDRSVGDESRKQLREAGVNVALEIDGEVYMSPCGITSAGTSTLATMQSIRLRRTVEAFCEQVEDNPQWLTGLILQAGRAPPPHPDLRFVFLKEGYGILETRSQTIVRLH